jgi:uncharacterized protein YqgV (UPF0045/DUF77 family)
MPTDSSSRDGETGLQFSVYPLRQADIDAPIRAAIKAAAGAGAEVTVGRLSTLASGDEDAVFAAARAAFDAAAAHGPTVMIATFTTGLPTGETVAEIQSGLTP